MVLEQALNRLKKVSSNTVATSIGFTASNEVKSGNVASLLLDGKVKSIESEKSISGTFMDSVAINSTRTLVLYYRANEIDGYSVYAKFIDITNYGVSILSDEIILDTNVVISQGDRFTLVKEPNGSRIVAFKMPIINIGVEARIGGDFVEIGKNSFPLLLTISGDNIQTDMIQDNTENSVTNNLISVTTHQAKEKFIAAFYTGGVALSSLQLETMIKDETTTYSFSETSAIDVLDSYTPVSLSYDSINQKISVTGILGEAK